MRFLTAQGEIAPRPNRSLEPATGSAVEAVRTYRDYPLINTQQAVRRFVANVARNPEGRELSPGNR